MLNIKNKGKIESGDITVQKFTDHFKKMCEVVQDDTFESNIVIPPENVKLNEPFSVDEIFKVCKALKNNKACGIDLILNEFLKNCPSEFYVLMTKYFNMILETGFVPSEWCVGIIQPIFKKKGSVNEPDNYRGITLLSCMSKVFTALLNNRLGEFLEEHDKLGQEQTAFRHGYSTLDHIFTLHTLIEMYLQKGKRMYCAFVDYQKAFDLINRCKLWHKIVKNGVSGKMLTVVQCLYANAKSRVKYGSKISKTSFNCNTGIRQGENLSPLLFCIYLNDFEEALSKCYNGLKHVSENYAAFLNNDLEVMLKLYLLLYADDTVILTEDAAELQCALEGLYNYCNEWDLKVNTLKTKVVIFSKGKIRKKPVFKFGNETVQIVDDYVYLGCIFNYNGRYTKAINERVNQGRRAMFGLLSKKNQLNLPLDITCELFDTLVTPVLLYACEVWGFENINAIETLHVKFCKMLLKINKTSANCIALGELGRLKLKRQIDKRIINFWIKLETGNQSKISCKLLQLSKAMYEADVYEPKWVKNVKNIIDKCGFTNMWNNVINPKWLKCALHLKLEDISKQEWISEVNSNSKCINYRIFKNELGFEKYLTLLNGKKRIMLSKFRCGNHKLPVTTGRYVGIPRNERKCNLCNCNVIGDEYHYLLECKDQDICKERKHCIKPSASKNHNTEKMKQLLNSLNKNKLGALAAFASTIMAKF